MAILEKRKSVNQLPRFERYQDTQGGDRSNALYGFPPITSRVQGSIPVDGSSVVNSPNVNGNGVTSTFSPTGSTSNVNPSISNPATKLPNLTSKTKGAGITSTGTGAASTKPTTTKNPSTETLTSTGTGTSKTPATSVKASTNTNTGSTLGKTLINGLAGAAVGVGAKAVIDKLTGANKTVNSNNNSGSNVVKNNNTGSNVVKNTTGNTGLTSTVKNAGTTTGNTSGAASKGNTVNVGGGNSGTKSIAGGTSGSTKTAGAVAGATTTGAGSDVTGVAYDDNGNLMPGYQLDENGNPVWVGDNNGATIYNPDGSVKDNLFVDADGNIYDAEGNLVQYADGTTPDSGSTDTSSNMAYTDDQGNTYDADGNLIASADNSDVILYDDQGNSYDQNGNLIAYADGSDPNADNFGSSDILLADNSNNSDNSDNIDTSSSSDSIEVKEGGEIRGGLHHFATGGFKYGNPSTAANYQANGQLTAADPVKLQAFLNNIPVDNTSSSNTTTSSDPVATNENSDGTTTQYFDDGSSITYDSNGNVTDVTDATVTNDSSGSSPSNTNSDVASQAGAGNRVYYDDGSSMETFDDGSTITYDSNGDVYKTTDAYQSSVDDYGNTTVTDSYGNIVNVYDPQGNIIPLGGGKETPTKITSAGSGNSAVRLNPQKTAQQLADEAAQKKIDDANQQSALDKLLSGLNTHTGAGVAGGVLGALLGNSDLFSGSNSNNSANHIDMSQVGVINPRTTDFGIGPANYVGYDQYGTQQKMPELYGNELYQNLNAPGFNEVNPGDYAAMDAQNNTQANAQGMADGGMPDYDAPDQSDGMTPTGGLPQGGLGASQTFYTFGNPVDPMQNLYNPQPAQQQPMMQPQPAQQYAQGMPPQAMQNQQRAMTSQPVQSMPLGMPQGAPQGQNMGLPKPTMPQQSPMQAGPQGLKSGGLPAWSNVPITDGRLNFRDGAPVHGAGDGQSDDIPAMLADGEYVIDAETVAQIGNGSTKAGAQALDKFRENIRAHKRSAPVNKIPPKTKALTSYLRGAK